MAKDGFKSYKSNLNVPQRRMSRFAYSVENAVARERVRNQAPTVVLPRYNERNSHNSVLLQPFIKAYVDPESTELVVERGANLEPMRMYELVQMKCLTDEDILALAFMNIHCKPKFEGGAKEYMTLIKKLENIVRGILDHQPMGRL
ncbi:hypothetical protein L1987_00944 [Smallanthus sonchifolius]|uniref:Uncharacterized protein n=1 Tax=Smallanthus sonchifolius TaxID=185202 RepID=A0ACB9K3Q0_9ASTR|nr:hypothetical protein L1987_00944 [Smallanthus sonchifolius]